MQPHCFENEAERKKIVIIIIRISFTIFFALSFPLVIAGWLFGGFDFAKLTEQLTYPLAPSAERGSTISFLGGVRAKGSGETKEKAIIDAQRNAVEKVVGVYISSKTQVEDFRKVRSRIIVEAHGYVSAVQVIGEKKLDKQGLWEVEITCKVNEKQIVAGIDAFKEQFGRRVVVLVPGDLSTPAKPIVQADRHLAEKIKSFLNRKGFDIYWEVMARADWNDIIADFDKDMIGLKFAVLKDIPAHFYIFVKVEKQIISGEQKIKVTAICRDSLGNRFADIDGQSYLVGEISDVATMEQAIDTWAQEINQMLYRNLVHKITQLGPNEPFRFDFIGYDNQEQWKIRLEIVKLLKELNVETQKIRPNNASGNRMIWNIKVPGEFELRLRFALKRFPGNWYNIGTWFFMVRPYTVLGIELRCWAMIGTIVIVIAAMIAAYLLVAAASKANSLAYPSYPEIIRFFFGIISGRKIILAMSNSHRRPWFHH